MRASDGYQIWSHSYDRQLTDIFAIQDGIAADVVKNLKVKLLGALPTVRQTNPKAYVLYLQARQLGNQFTADASKSSKALLQQALVIDPDYAPAHAQLGFLAELQNACPLLHNTLSARWCWTRPILMCFATAPSCWMPLAARNRRSRSANTSSRDPVNPTALQNLGGFYLGAGRYDEAIAELRTLLSLSPGFGSAHYLLGHALLLKGDAAGGLVRCTRRRRRCGDRLACRWRTAHWGARRTRRSRR